MIKYALIGAALMALTVAIHAFGTVALVEALLRRQADDISRSRWRAILQALIGAILWLLMLHLLEIVIWASAFLVLELADDLRTLEEAIYFSFVTYTTLGYGDITLSGPWRIMSGIEALNGVLLAGWSTALLFAIVQRLLQLIQLQGEPK